MSIIQYGMGIKTGAYLKRIPLISLDGDQKTRSLQEVDFPSDNRRR